MRWLRRAATTIAAPSAARAFAIAAPMPWPPPVTTATAPSKRRNHGLLEDRAQRFSQPGPLVGTGRRGIAKVGAWAARLLERLLAGADGGRERARVGRQPAPQRLADGSGTLAQDDRALELARMACAAPELVAQARAPRLAREVREDDRQEAGAARPSHRFMQRREMFRIEVGVGERQETEAVLGQASREIDGERRDGDARNGPRYLKS